MVIPGHNSMVVERVSDDNVGGCELMDVGEPGGRLGNKTNVTVLETYVFGQVEQT